MPYIRRYRLRKPLYRRRRPAGARRLPLYARPSLMRRVVSSSPTFTETFRFADIISTTGGSIAGLWKFRFLDIPQYAQYANLYNQYCIKRAVITLIPSYNTYNAHTEITAAPTAVTAPRLVFAINDSAQQPTPVVENDVLTDNGCKIRTLNRPVKIAFRPVAEVGMSASSGGFVSETKRTRWLSTASPEIFHSGVSWAMTQMVFPSVVGEPMATMYVKLTFSLRDPK